MKAIDFLNAELLPFRRILKENEYDMLKGRLEKRWGNWYGGAPMPPSVKVESTITLHSIFMEKNDATLKVRKILRQLGSERIFELNEDKTAIEMDLDWATFDYGGLECFYVPADMQWMIYASHESSITFAGNHLINQIQTTWPDWKKYVYKATI